MLEFLLVMNLCATSKFKSIPRHVPSIIVSTSVFGSPTCLCIGDYVGINVFVRPGICL